MEPIEGNGISVLLVDADPDAAASTATALERESRRLAVETATGVRDGVDRLADARVDCIVSEYELSDRDGIAFLQTVRERYGERPFILYTGAGSDAIAERAIAAGVTDYRRKRADDERVALLAERIVDVVERHRARTRGSGRDREFRGERDCFASLFESLPAPVVYGELAADGPIIERANRAFEETFGVDADEVVGENLVDLTVPEACRSEAASITDEALENGYVKTEVARRTADGLRDFVLNVVVQEGPDGARKGYAIYTDITERKDRERKLRARTQAMEQATDGIAIYDVSNDEYAYVNQAHAEVYGYDDPAAFLGETWQICYDDDEIERMERDVLSQLVETGSWRGEATGVREDGSTFPQELSLTQVDDGRVICVVRDITERKARVRALRETTRQLQAVLDTVSAAIFVKDADGRYQLMNDNCRELLGVGADAAVTGKTDEAFFPDDVAARYRADDRRVLETGETLEVEEEVPTPEGTRIHLTRKSPILDGEGEPYAVCAVSTDITERKERERQLERQNERLDEFASIVSHDLRNPLNIAQSYLKIAREERDSDHLDRVDTALERISQIVDQTLSLARSGRTIGTKAPVDLARLARRCWNGVNTAAAELEVDDPPTVEADPQRLRHLFENLFRNAVEHGGSDVTVRVGRCEGGFYVEDDGVGFPEDAGEDLLSPSHAVGGEDTGLGLAIVNRIVEAHGWEIRATDGVAGGSDGGGTTAKRRNGRSVGARFEITGVDERE